MGHRANGARTGLRAASSAAGRPPAAQRALPRIVALVRDRVTLARLTDAVRPAATLVPCVEVDHARAASADASVVVLDAQDGTGAPTDVLIRELRERAPALPILVYVDPRALPGDAVVAAVQAGATGLLFHGRDDVAVTVRAAVDAAARRATAGAVLRALHATIPGAVRPIVELAVSRASAPVTVEDLASALGVHRKTVACRLRAARYPEPRILIGWCRLFHAVGTLSATRQPAERVAGDLGFPSATAMRNLLRRYTGLRPADVRAGGGLDLVVHHFRAAIAADRAHARRGTCPHPGVSE